MLFMFKCTKFDMDRKGVGYGYEMLMALAILILAITFYAQDLTDAIAPVLVILGGVMLVGGMVMREPIVVTAGIMMFVIALVYNEMI